MVKVGRVETPARPAGYLPRFPFTRKGFKMVQQLHCLLAFMGYLLLVVLFSRGARRYRNWHRMAHVLLVLAAGLALAASLVSEQANAPAGGVQQFLPARAPAR
jgi:hypothetical protein